MFFACKGKKSDSMLIKSTYIVIQSKRQLKSYAGVDLETYTVTSKIYRTGNPKKGRFSQSRR
jgi:hypothetical protein